MVHRGCLCGSPLPSLADDVVIPLESGGADRVDPRVLAQAVSGRAALGVRVHQLFVGARNEVTGKLVMGKSGTDYDNDFEIHETDRVQGGWGSSTLLR